MTSASTTIPRLSILPALVLALGGCEVGAGSADAASDDAVEDVYRSAHHSFRLVTVVDGLQHPWSLAFLPDGDMLVTERGGGGENARPPQLRIIRDGALLPDPVEGLPEVRAGGQGGLLDIALHPDFEANRLVYLSYSKPNDDDSEGTTAVIRGRLADDELGEVEEIFEAQAWTGGRGHHGSRLAFDEEGYLFITVGDRQVSPSGDLEAHPAQDPTNHFGTIVRLHDDGTVPDDNPFVDDPDALPEIWSYGHRNPQGLAHDPVTDRLWANEHGPQGGDELNLVQPGLNYGWPVIGYGVNYGAGRPIHEQVHGEDMESPITTWVPSIAPAGLLVYHGDRFPEWQGSLFVAGMSADHRVLARITVDGARVVNEESLLRGEHRIRDVRQGPDGHIYLVTDHRGGELTPILRMEPAPGA